MKSFLPFLLVFFTCFSSSAQSGSWTPLFNGKNLDGWNQKNGNAIFEVINGEIVGTAVPNTPNSFLCTNENYSDFILELEVLIEDQMNSGIQFRSLSTPDYQNGRVHGYQLELDPTPRAWSGGIYDEGRRDWLYIPNINPDGKKAFKVGTWNSLRIEAIGNTLRTWINGIPVAHLIDDMTSTGFIALQVHSIYGDMKEGMRVRWKNIKIQTKDLKSSSPDNIPVHNLIPNSISFQEQHLGFELLFNGSNLQNWRNVYSQDSPSKRWKVESGAILVNSSDGSETGNDIVTRSNYSAFEFTFEFKITEGANSGIKYFVNENFDSGGKSGIGLEYQILDDDKHPDAQQGAAGNRTLASLYDLIPPKKPDARFLKKPGQWNYGRIIVYPDQRVQHWLNGFLVVEYERKSPLFNALVARSKYQIFPGFGLQDEGPLLLQDHGDEVAFRSLKIRKLN
jgi:hypothetical protein